MCDKFTIQLFTMICHIVLVNRKTELVQVCAKQYIKLFIVAWL